MSIHVVKRVSWQDVQCCVAGAVSDQIRFCLTSVLARMISFLMIAVTATFPGFSAFRSCRYLARRSGLYRVAAKAGHVEPAPQPRASALGEVFAFPGSGLPRHRCDPGQAGHLPGFQSSDLGQLREESGRCRSRDSRNRGQDPVDPRQFRIGLDQSRDFRFQSGPFAFDLAKSISSLTLEQLGVKLGQPVFYGGAFLAPGSSGLVAIPSTGVAEAKAG